MFKVVAVQLNTELTEVVKPTEVNYESAELVSQNRILLVMSC